MAYVKKGGQGGARKGAGRKPLPPEQRKVRLVFYCTQKQAERLSKAAEKILKK